MLPTNYYRVLQNYECTNRVTRAKIKMTKIRFLTKSKTRTIGFYVSCMTHGSTCQFRNKSESLYHVHKPWTFCDGCAEIHLNAVSQESLEA